MFVYLQHQKYAFLGRKTCAVKSSIIMNDTRKPLLTVSRKQQQKPQQQLQHFHYSTQHMSKLITVKISLSTHKQEFPPNMFQGKLIWWFMFQKGVLVLCCHVIVCIISSGLKKIKYITTKKSTNNTNYSSPLPFFLSFYIISHLNLHFLWNVFKMYSAKNKRKQSAQDIKYSK